MIGLIVKELSFISWAAGVLEGEGTVTIINTGRRKYTKPLVTITSTDENMVLPFQNRWPGTYKSWEPKNPRAKTAFTWSIFRYGQILRFLTDVYPYLKTPRVIQKVDLVIADISLRRQGGRDPMYKTNCHARREQIRALNQRGRPLLEGPK